MAMLTSGADPAEWLSRLSSNPVATFFLRAALGVYIVYMARGFSADPMAYFRKRMPRMTEPAWIRSAVRALALFCVWGGCFIFLTAVATQIFGLHGITLACLLVTLAAGATWLLLPRVQSPPEDDKSGRGNLRGTD